jgi:hypothetical protein
MGDGEVRQDRPVRRRLDRRFLSGRFQVSFIDRSIVPLHSSSSDMFRKTTADESRVEQCSSGTCPNPSRYPGEPLLCTAPIKVTIYFNFANVFDQCWGCVFFSELKPYSAAAWLLIAVQIRELLGELHVLGQGQRPVPAHQPARRLRLRPLHRRSRERT